MDQKQTGSQPAFYHNKSKHTKSPERFSAIKTPTPSPASISGSCAPSLSPSNPPFLSATLSPPSLVTAPPDAFPPFRSFSLYSPLSLSVILSSLHIVLLLRCPCYSYTNTYHYHPHTHTLTVPFPFSFFLKTNLLLMCVYIPPSHSFNSVSLTSLRGSKLEAIATHTFPLQLSAWHQIYIHNEQAQHFSCCLAHGLHVNQRAGFFSKWTFVPVLWYLYTHWSKSTSQLIWNIMLSFVSIIKGFIFSQRKGAEEITTSLMSGQHLWSTSWLWGETTCLTLPKNMSKAH